MADKSEIDTTSLATQISNANESKPNRLDHNLHPSLTNTVVQQQGVTNSIFLHHKQKQQEQPIHGHHPSIARISNKVASAKNMFEDKPKSFEHDHTASVYVLGDAQLAEKGIDFWENKRNHSRVNTQWWRNQIQMRKQIKKHHKTSSNASLSMRQHNVRINISANTYTSSVADNYTPTGGNGSPSVEESVIEHSVTASQREQTPDIVAAADEDLNDEYEALLEEYRYASKQILQVETEKQENMLLLNEQKELITDQNVKIEELQRQLKVFEDALTEANTINANNNEVFLEKLEQNLALNAKNVVVSEQITNQITETVNRNFKEQIQSVLGDAQKGTNEEVLANEIRAKNKDIEAMKERLNAKEVSESDLRNKLNDTKDQIINLQRQTLNADKGKEMEILKLTQNLNETAFEKKQLEKSVEDLKYELELQRRMKGEVMDQDDVKEQSNENTPLLSHKQEDTVSKKRSGRTPRNNARQAEYVGLKPKEYFLQREWCCGFVCCDNACGCGSY
eukprot:798896_1